MNTYYFYDTVIDPPTTLNAGNILTTSISFSWSEASCSSNCPDGITGYIYNLIDVATETLIDQGTPGANERMVTVEGLTMCTEYEFHVAGMSGSVRGNYLRKSVTTAAGIGRYQAYVKRLQVEK